MEKSAIIDVLSDWNFWQKDADTGIIREEYARKIEKFLKTGQIVTLSGVRRAGKSTIMKQCLSGLIKNGLQRKNTLFINFEDPRFSSELSAGLMQKMYETYIEYMNPENKPYLFLDEVQNVPAWEKFARALNERGEGHIVVSGSSSKLLSEEFGTVLTGRHLSIPVFPLGFEEFLKFKGVEIAEKMDLASKRHELRRILREYLEFGAFPKVALSAGAEEKKQLLLDYYEDILSRDVIARQKIKATEKLKALSKYYITNTSSPISFNSIKKFLGIPIHTVERFSYHLSSAYLFSFVKRHSYSLKEQEKNPRKAYCIDTGLRNAVSFRFSEDTGKVAENAVFLELMRRGKEIYYWKDERQREVDFLICEGQKVKQLIQASWDFESAKTKEREIDALLRAMGEFKLKTGTVITGDFEETEKIGGKEIIYIPLWKWLLQQG